MDIETLLRRISRFFVAGTCQACGRCLTTPEDVCADCFDDIDLVDGNLCSVCGRALDFEFELESIERYTCGDCRKDPPDFDQFRSGFYYTKSARKILHALKFESKSSLAKPLAKMAKPVFTRWPPLHETDMVIPVPLSVKKLWRRGYNPAYLLARELFSDFKIPVVEGTLRRVRDTAPQYSLKPADRKKNVRKAFKLKNAKIVEGKNILLFDDIYTTGATVSECVKAIRKGKPSLLSVATLTRSSHGAEENSPEES
jgi:ComF family protein